jgi:sulfatase maturation enzyme AslB (radical SAM superfamily)
MYFNHHSEKLFNLLTKNGEKLYCTIPFRHLILATNGVKCCTWLYEKEGLNYVSLIENKKLNKIWQDDELMRVRNSIRDGTYRYCNLAYCPEVKGESKNLLSLMEIKNTYPYIADFLEGKENAEIGEPDFVNISNDSTCNLRCPSCSRDKLPSHNRKKKKHMLRSLNAISKNLKTIFLAGMGEPFFSPVYVDWIMNFKSSEYPKLETIHINTNAQLLTPACWKTLPQDFRSFNKIFTVSVDGATAKIYEKNRPGGSFDKLLNNLALLKKLRKNNEISLLRMYFVYQDNNYKEIPEIIKIASEFSFDKIFFARISNWGSFSHSKYLKLDIGNPKHSKYKSFRRIINNINDSGENNKQPEITFMT